jgi:hypothetical protein
MNCISKYSKHNFVAAIIDNIKTSISNQIIHPIENITSAFIQAEIKENSLQISWQPVALISLISIIGGVLMKILYASDSSPSIKTPIIILCICVILYIAYKYRQD